VVKEERDDGNYARDHNRRLQNYRQRTDIGEQKGYRNHPDQGGGKKHPPGNISEKSKRVT